MAGGAEPLDPESHALWTRVAASVRPLFGRKPLAAPPAAPRFTPPDPAPAAAAPPPRRGAPAQNTLDAGWDRRLARGLAPPDMTLDLHGHTLAGAHAALDAGLARAVASHARLVLLVTGRPPKEGWSAGPRRGAIRAAVPDWLAASRFADHIAAVRHAHPRHGGAGALYVIVRRARSG